jgi:hypothetical protein
MISIILAGLAGMIISVVIGSFWYSGATPMGRWHMQYLGFDKLTEEQKQKMITEAKPKMWKTYLAQMILSFITSLFIASTLYYTVQNGGPANSVYFYVFSIWLAFIVPMVGQGLLWGTTEGALAWKRFFSDSFCNLVTFLVIAFVCVLII